MDGAKKKLILIDDHIIVRNGLKELIQKLGPYQISDEFDNGRDFVNALPLAYNPDLLIMDLSMPEMNGEEVVAHLKKHRIEMPVLILTLNHNEDRIVKLFRDGIRGYLEKNCSAATMKQAIEDILRAGYYHNDLLAYALRDSGTPKKNERDLILERLTGREKEFLDLVCHPEEYTYEQIADMMGVVPRTVDGYRASIFEKFDIRSKTGLVLFAIKHRLVNIFGNE